MFEIRNETGETANENPHRELRKSHGILNMIGWGIMMIIGAIVARYCKQWDPIWFYLHTGIQSLGFLLGIAGIICGFLLEDRLSVDVSTHKGLGIFILVLGSLQVCNPLSLKLIDLLINFNCFIIRMNK